MDEGVKSPDGNWMWTDKGWLFLASDSCNTPDGCWSISQGVFEKSPQHVNLSPQVVSDVAVSGTLDSELHNVNALNAPAIETRDSVIMGNVTSNVNIQQGIDLPTVTQAFRSMFEELGIGVHNQPAHLSSFQRNKLVETIDDFDKKKSAGLTFDAETEYLIANAVRVAGDWRGAEKRYIRFIEDYPESQLAFEAMHNLGKILVQMQRFVEAEKYLKDARNSFTQINNWQGVADTLLTQGSLEAERKESDIAAALFKRARTVAQQHNIVGTKIRAHMNLGFLQWNIGQLDVAKVTLREALVDARAVNDVEGVRSINTTLSQISAEQGNLEQSLELSRSARTNTGAMENEYSKAVAESEEARRQNHRGNHKLARQGFVSAIARFKLMDAHRKTAEVFSSLGELEESLDNFEEAISAYQSGGQAFEQAGDREGYTQMLVNLSGVLLMNHQFAEASHWGEIAFEEAVKLNDYEHQTYALVNFGIAVSNQGRHEDARKAFEKARDIGTQHGLDTSNIP